MKTTTETQNRAFDFKSNPARDLYWSTRNAQETFIIFKQQIEISTGFDSTVVALVVVLLREHRNLKKRAEKQQQQHHFKRQIQFDYWPTWNQVFANLSTDQKKKKSCRRVLCPYVSLSQVLELQTFFFIFWRQQSPNLLHNSWSLSLSRVDIKLEMFTVTQNPIVFTNSRIQ